MNLSRTLLAGAAVALCPAWLVAGLPSDPKERAKLVGQPTALEVRPAAANEAELWARVVAQGFSGQEEIGPAALGAGTALFDLPAVQCFLGLVGGEPAGGGAVYPATGAQR